MTSQYLGHTKCVAAAAGMHIRGSLTNNKMIAGVPCVLILTRGTCPLADRSIDCVIVCKVTLIISTRIRIYSE